MSPHRFPSRPPSHQRGAILVQFALLALVLITVLGLVQIGYMYYAKRDLQRIADLAALEAVNALVYGEPDTCPDAEHAAERSITAQLFLSLNDEVRNIECGHWDSRQLDAQRFTTSFGAPPGNPLNSARVTLQGETLKLLPFTGSRIVAASAIAAKESEPVAAFSIGSQLLRFENNSVLGRILEGTGLDVGELRVLDKDGIANAKITPSGLLRQIGLTVDVPDLSVLSPDELVNLNASLLDILDAAIAAGSDSLLNAGVDMARLIALRAHAAATEIANIKVPLGGDKGLLALISAGGDASPIGAGLDTAIDVAELVRTHLTLANGENALALSLSVIPGLVNANLTVVEPPSIAIGPANGLTKARSAQVRLSLNIGQSGRGNAGLLGVLGVHLKLPIQVDLVRSTGTLEAIQCNAITADRTANISVRSAIGDVCIGTLDSNGVCQETRLVDVDVLNLLGGVKIDGKVSTSLLEGASLSSPPNAQACPFNHSSLDECLTGMRIDEPVMSGPNGLRLGQTVSNLLNALPSVVGDVGNAQPSGLLGAVLGPLLWLIGGLTAVLELVVGVVATVVTTLLSPILDVIGSVLDGLMTSLGLELGRAEVELLNIQCDTAQLVH